MPRFRVDLGIFPRLFTIILQQFEYLNTAHLYLIYYVLYVGESGVVYKGYIDTSLGSELVAVKTGKGKQQCSLGLHEHIYVPSNM